MVLSGDAAQAPLLRESEWYEDAAIELRVGTAATSVDLDTPRITPNTGAELSFDGLVTVTGAVPTRLRTGNGRPRDNTGMIVDGSPSEYGSAAAYVDGGRVTRVAPSDRSSQFRRIRALLGRSIPLATARDTLSPQPPQFRRT